MTNFSDAFLLAVDHAMLYEVGPFWNPNDPDVIRGTTGTRDRNRKVGYVNIPADRGGETKYGIAQNPNPKINVSALTLAESREVYYSEYWKSGSCDKLPEAVAIMHFDACINHGVGRACKMLQESVGAVQDGAIGPKTLKAIQSTPQEKIINSLFNTRKNFYNYLVSRNSSQKIFLNGWMNRINEVSKYALNKIK